MRRIYNFDDLEVGKKYHVEISCWTANVLFCGKDPSNNRKYMFTFGDRVEDWYKSFNFCDYKSNFKVYSLLSKEGGEVV